MMQESKYLKQSIDTLEVNRNVIDTLKKNNINTLGELSTYRKSELKGFGLLTSEVNKVEIELELLGLSLKGSL
jgi:DNA-directed RNA polymerase alpha subunit